MEDVIQLPTPFIVGASRSGTTLLRLMLDAHPDLSIPPESHFLPELIEKCARAADPSGTCATTLTSFARWPDFHIDESDLRGIVNACVPFDVAQVIRALYQFYAGRHRKSRWGDKTPGYVRCMPRLAEVLPEAHFIHLIRDGRDVFASVRDLWFGPDTVQEAATEWAAAVRLARRDAGTLTRYREVRYEDLVREPRGTLEALAHYLDLPWSDDMLEYYRGAQFRLDELRRRVRPVNGGDEIDGNARIALHARARQPPTTARIGRWRSVLSRAEVRTYEDIAGSELTACGYVLEA